MSFSDHNTYYLFLYRWRSTRRRTKKPSRKNLELDVRLIYKLHPSSERSRTLFETETRAEFRIKQHTRNTTHVPGYHMWELALDCKKVTMTSSRSRFDSAACEKQDVLKPGASLASWHLGPANNSYAYIPGLASTFPPDEDDAHGQDEDLSFTTAYDNGVAAGDGQNIRITPKKSSNIDFIAKPERATKTMQNPCLTPEGLRPRKSVEGIRAEISLKLGSINPDTGGSICRSKLETAKKTNVSFSSHRSSLGSICSSLDDKFDVFKRDDAVRSVAATGSKKKCRKMKQTIDAAISPHLSIGRVRTLVGLLAAQNELWEGEFSSDGTAYSHRKPGSKTGDDEALEFRSHPILPPYHNDFPGESPYSSDDDDDSDTTEESNSQHLYNEWCQYEKYQDGQEAAQGDSFSSYNSRHVLVETNEHQSDRSHHVGNEKSENIYDFSPLEEELGDDKVGSTYNGNDPFVVRGHDSSWISDISQNTSSQTDNDTCSERAKHTLLQTGTLLPVTEGCMNSNTCATKDFDSRSNGSIPYELSTQSALEEKRLRKESLITELVHRLKDNKNLIRNIETLDAGRRRHDDLDEVRNVFLHACTWYIVHIDLWLKPCTNSIENLHRKEFFTTTVGRLEVLSFLRCIALL